MTLRGYPPDDVESLPAARRRAVGLSPCRVARENLAGKNSRFLVTVEPIGGPWSSVPATVRLRRWLKSAARGFGLRCVSITRED
jgi:hypothetical protein